MKEQNQEDPLKNIAEIRSLMEQSSRFISLSGLSGVFAGLSALLGATAAYLYFDSGLFSTGFYEEIGRSARHPLAHYITFGLVDAFCVLALAIGSSIILTVRKAKKQGMPVWNSAVKRMLINLLIPLFTGGIFCVLLFYHGIIFLVAPCTLIFYGMALLNAGKYTLHDIKYLGMLEICLGLLAAFLPGYGLMFWTLGFGVFHILYGIVMYYKYDR